MAYISPTLKSTINAVKKATNSMNRDFSEMEKILTSVKNYSNFVAAAFERVEKNINFELAKIKPDYLISKNIIENPKNSYFLVSNDGVANFAHGMAFFTICVSVLDANNNVVISVMYNPAMDEMFFAEKGAGAYKEGFRSQERLRVSATKDIDKSFVATNFAYDKFDNIRAFGSTSLEMAYLASGKLDAVIVKDANKGCIAAGALLVKEAGGYIYEVEQKDMRSEDILKVLSSDGVLAANGVIGKKMHELLNSKK